MSSVPSNSNGLQLHKLVRHILRGVKTDNPESEAHLISSHFRSALQLLSSAAASASAHGSLPGLSELEVAEKIKKQLAREGRPEDAAKFSELHNRLQRSPIIKNREGLLILFLSLSEKPRVYKVTPHFSVTSSEASVPSPKVIAKTNGTTQVNKNYHPPVPPKPIARLAPNYASNSELIRELIFVFQGIEGKIIRRDSKNDRYAISHEYRNKFSVPIVSQVLRLSELGWLYNKLHSYCVVQSEDARNIGLIGQSFVSALKEELTEYYRLLSTLESNLNSLNISHLTVWTLEPMERMKTLASIVEACSKAKGGGIISIIYSFLHHGNPHISETVKNLLCTVCKPLYTMILKWITDGTLEDPFGEFFIASDPKIQSDRLWQDKYSIRRSMIPKFLTLPWVKKILATGKSINFLHEVCHDSSPISGREIVKENLERTSPENLFSDPVDNLLHSTIQRAYTDTSNHVLNILFTRYKFLDHVSAMRKYLLLGQGDIIRYLLELLEEELCKPATSLYPHNLAGILETAIRATNAQYEDPEILERLDVRLLEIQPGDTGWDVFSLDYKVTGPIGTVFRHRAMTHYLMLFNALWRAKRMEWLLSYAWKRQSSLHKLSNDISELAPVLHIADLLSSEMIHFIHQMAYYITFEVMECSWDFLITRLRQAESLDQIIEAHEEFLETLLRRALLDDCSKPILTQLRAIYDRIIEFQSVQSKLYVYAVAEAEARRSFEAEIQRRIDAGSFGLTQEEEDDDAERRKEFNKVTLSGIKAQFKIICQSYQDMTRAFLLQLTSSQDVSLQFLSFRLDFNGHYKRTDARLGTPLTFQHRRESAIDF